jgi:hypothetical protein
MGKLAITVTKSQKDIDSNNDNNFTRSDKDFDMFLQYV